MINTIIGAIFLTALIVLWIQAVAKAMNDFIWRNE